jgi:hypothetical protein
MKLHCESKRNAFYDYYRHVANIHKLRHCVYIIHAKNIILLCFVSTRYEQMAHKFRKFCCVAEINIRKSGL